MKYFKLFENFISEPLNEAMSFDEIKDKYLENPYGIGAQIIEFIEGERGNGNRLIFKHDSRFSRDKIEAKLKTMGFAAKKLSKSTADKAYKYPYEVTLYESEAFDINEGKIDKATIMVAKHKAGHMVMNVHHWNEERHLKDYMDSNKNSGDNFYEVSKKELDSKIADLQKEYNVKDKDIQVYEAKVSEAYKHKFEIGAYVKFGREKARIDNVYTSSSGKAMYTIGSGKRGAIDVEAQDVDAKN
jgi:hypothetical protein